MNSLFDFYLYYYSILLYIGLEVVMNFFVLLSFPLSLLKDISFDVVILKLKNIDDYIKISVVVVVGFSLRFLVEFVLNTKKKFRSVLIEYWLESGNRLEHSSMFLEDVVDLLKYFLREQSDVTVVTWNSD